MTTSQKNPLATGFHVGQVVTEINRRTNAEYRAFHPENLFGEKYQAADIKGKISFLSCVFCGRDTSKQGNSEGVMVGGGGAIIVHPEDYDISSDGGSMGWFPVGSECIKTVPAEFRLANIYDDKVKGV
jgi:hypothetical protein